MKTRTYVRSARIVVLLTSCLVLLARPSPLGAVDFIRGDMNGDGSVSIADAYSMLRWMFHGLGSIRCQDSMDVDDNGTLNTPTPRMGRARSREKSRPPFFARVCRDGSVRLQPER
jgi:hypothetical protein